MTADIPDFVQEAEEAMARGEMPPGMEGSEEVTRKMVEETVEFGLEEYQKNYINRYKDTNFQLYRKYTYEEVCLLLTGAKT